MFNCTNLSFPTLPQLFSSLSNHKPELKTVKFTLGVASTISRLVRCIVIVSNRILNFPLQTKTFAGGTYFVSAVRIPVSIYDVVAATLDLKNVESWGDIFRTCSKISGKCGIVSNDTFHILKGLSCVGILGRKQLWMLGCTPYTIVFATISFFGRVYNNYMTLANSSSNLRNEEQYGITESRKVVLKAEITNHRLAFVATTLDMVGLAILSFTPLIVPGYTLLGASAVVSLSRYVYNGNNE